MHKFESSGCVHSFLSSSYHVFIPLFSLSLGVPDSVPVRQRARVRKQRASSYRQDVEPRDSLQETHPTQKGRSVTAYSEFKRKQEEWLSVYYAEHFVLQLMSELNKWLNKSFCTLPGEFMWETHDNLYK